jgi:hypothetical protein
MNGPRDPDALAAFKGIAAALLIVIAASATAALLYKLLNL